MIGGQLHHEGSGITGEHLGLLQHDAGDDDGGHADEVSGGGDPCAAAEDGACDHGDEGDLGAAGDEGGGHNGHPAVAFIFDGTGSHDTGHAAAHADEHGDEGLAGQAELAEHAVQHEGDTGHVAAGLQEGQHQEQNQHLGHEAQHRAHTGHDTVIDQAAEPVGGAGRLQTIADQHGDTGDPHAVVGGVGGVKSVFSEILHGVHKGHLHHVVQLVRTLGQGVIVGGHGVDGQGLLVLHVHGGGGGAGLEALHFCQQGLGVKVLGLGVDLRAQEGVHSLDGGGVIVVDGVILLAADAQQVPAVAEHAVVGPVGGGSAHGYHGDPVNQEHHHGEDGQAQPAVGDHLVDLVGGGQLALVLLLVAALDDLGDVNIALVGDDALGVVVQLLFGGLDVLLDVLHHVGGDAELLQHLVVPLEDLDGIPALLLLGQGVDGGLLNVGNGVLHGAGEGVHGDGLGLALGGLHGGLGGVHHAVALQSGDLHDLAAQLAGQLLDVDLVAVLANHVHHVHGDDHGDAQLRQLGGQIQVALQVGAVDDVQDGVGALADQVIPGYHLLQGVGGQGVDAGQVHDDHVIVLLQLALLLLHGDAGPVAHELVGAGEGVEQGGFAAVRVARQGNFDLLIHMILVSPFRELIPLRSFRCRPSAGSAHSPGR